MSTFFGRKPIKDSSNELVNGELSLLIMQKRDPAKAAFGFSVRQYELAPFAQDQVEPVFLNVIRETLESDEKNLPSVVKESPSFDSEAKQAAEVDSKKPQIEIRRKEIEPGVQGLTIEVINQPSKLKISCQLREHIETGVLFTSNITYQIDSSLKNKFLGMIDKKFPPAPEQEQLERPRPRLG